MGKIISFNNHKGGTAKTSDCAILAESLTRNGYKVLVVDLDPQANLSEAFGADTDNKTLTDLFLGKAGVADLIQSLHGVDVLPADILLTKVQESMRNEFFLKNALSSVKNDYDFILIDNGPSIEILTQNAIFASDYVVIPVQADYDSFRGAENLEDLIDYAKLRSNPDLKVLGIIINRFDKRSAISKQFQDYARAFAKTIDSEVFETPIRECVKIREARALHVPLFEYAPKSNASKDFEALTKEFLERVNHE